MCNGLVGGSMWLVEVRSLKSGNKERKGSNLMEHLSNTLMVINDVDDDLSCEKNTDPGCGQCRAR